MRMVILPTLHRHGYREFVRFLSTKVRGPLYKMAPLSAESKVRDIGLRRHGLLTTRTASSGSAKSIQSTANGMAGYATVSESSSLDSALC